jgi:hypothetical protein
MQRWPDGDSTVDGDDGRERRRNGRGCRFRASADDSLVEDDHGIEAKLQRLSPEPGVARNGEARRAPAS